MTANSRLICGDMRKALASLDPDTFDSVGTDPPYELGFMGKAWDKSGVAFDVETWRHVFRVLKPGAHLVAFGGTRTWHRIAVAIEDAGFEIRDNLAWLYGQGFPKSLDVSKAIDKAAGAERPVVGERRLTGNAGVPTKLKGGTYSVGTGLVADVTIPVTSSATELARQWEGWGTALKPSFEPIVLARKPPAGTIAANVARYGVGGLNIDGCRTPGGWDCQAQVVTSGGSIASPGAGALTVEHPGGRWPPNVCVDENVAADLDAINGVRRPGERPARRSGSVHIGPAGVGATTGTRTVLDTGGVSRYFYCPKAGAKERDAGLDHWPTLKGGDLCEDRKEGSAGLKNPRAGSGRGGDRRNPHPTVKPLELMRWLVRLITPPGGLVLDPFCGSGTTGVAAVLEGLNFVGIDLSEDYVRLSADRIAHWAALAARQLELSEFR